jgi:hypothetical protein
MRCHLCFMNKVRCVQYIPTNHMFIKKNTIKFYLHCLNIDFLFTLSNELIYNIRMSARSNARVQSY